MSNTSYLIISFYIGFSSFVDLAIFYNLKDNLKLSPSETTTIIGLSILPWSFKPIYGLIVDYMEIHGNKRKPYIILCSTLIFISWIGIIQYNMSIYIITLCLFMNNMSKSFLSIVSQTILVEQLRNENEEKIKKDVGMNFLIKNIGSLIAAYLKGNLIVMFSIVFVFKLASVFSFINVISIFYITDRSDDLYSYENENFLLNNEKKEVFKRNKISIDSQHLIYNQYENNIDSIDSKDNIHMINQGITSKTQNENEENDFFNENIIIKDDSDKENQTKTNHDFSKKLSKLKSILSNKSIQMIFLFMIILISTPNFLETLLYYLTDKLNYSPSDLSILAIIESLGNCISIIGYIFHFNIYKPLNLIILSVLFLLISNSLTFIVTDNLDQSLGISNFLLISISIFLFKASIELMTLPFLSLAVCVCPRELEGTVFSIFIGIINFSLFISNILGGFLTALLSITSTQFESFSLLIFICSFISVLSLSVVIILDREDYIDVHKGKGKLDDSRGKRVSIRSIITN